MAIMQLQIDGYPSIDRPHGEWYETRLFRTTSETEALTTFTFGAIADTAYFSSTTPALYYRDIRVRKRSKRDSSDSAFVWEVEVTAATLSNILSFNPDQSQLEEIESEGVPMYDSSGVLNYVECETRTSNIYVTTQSDMNRISAERQKIGLINASANNPFSGTVAEEWRCVDVFCRRNDSSLNNLRLVYKYYRAPRDADGNQQTWTDWGSAQTPALTMPTGDISPYR